MKSNKDEIQTQYRDQTTSGVVLAVLSTTITDHSSKTLGPISPPDWNLQHKAMNCFLEVAQITPH